MNRGDAFFFDNPAAAVVAGGHSDGGVTPVTTAETGPPCAQPLGDGGEAAMRRHDVVGFFPVVPEPGEL